MTKLIKKIAVFLKRLNQSKTYTPSHRVLNLLQNADNSYTAHIQIINKNITFYKKPEDILADDTFVNMFSPLDVRTLTYLGYLEINAPKYKILAQRMINNDKTIFIIRKTGEENVILKTANEILQEPNMISQMPSDDARVIGYTIAAENIQTEFNIKTTARKHRVHNNE